MTRLGEPAWRAGPRRDARNTSETPRVHAGDMTPRPRPPIAAGVAAALVVASLAFIWLIAGRGATPAASSPAASGPSEVALTSSAPSGSADSAASDEPATASSPPASTSPAPPVSPNPTAAPTAWSKARAVKGLGDCTSVVAAIDDNGTDHLAAVCGSGVRYSTSTDGRTWTTTTFQPPTNRTEYEPQLAFDGKTLYLAYTRVAPEEGGCGGDGLADVGVYYRVRTLPSGGWSAPTRLGAVADHLQAFRVNGTIHATVQSANGGATVYETLTGGTLKRYPIADATGWTSLRIGDDGKARIAYEGADSIEFGAFGTDSFATAPIPGSARGWDPVLALAPGNAAYMLWNRSYHGAGCVEPGPDPADGTYFGTNASGHWVSSRLTKLVGGASLALDPATADLHAVVTDYRTLVYFQKAAGSSWTHATLVSKGGPSSPVIRENPKTGALLVAFVVTGPGGPQGPTIVEVMTKP